MKETCTLNQDRIIEKFRHAFWRLKILCVCVCEREKERERKRERFFIMNNYFQVNVYFRFNDMDERERERDGTRTYPIFMSFLSNNFFFIFILVVGPSN